MNNPQPLTRDSVAPDFDIEKAPEVKSTLFEPPAIREKGIMVADVPALVDALKSKGLV